jgi:hypothetical protein
MFRKLVLALAAVAVIGTAGLAPTTADAHWKGKFWKPYWGHGYGFGFYAPVYPAYDCIRLVRTRFGWREMNVCY